MNYVPGDNYNYVLELQVRVCLLHYKQCCDNKLILQGTLVNLTQRHKTKWTFCGIENIVV